MAILVNVVMLLTKLTKTVNIDVWNIWHMDFTGDIAYTVTGNFGVGILGVVVHAAILAGVGVGMYESFEDAVAQTVQITRRYEPNHANDNVYGKNYETYLALYENLKDLMKRNAE
mgnify:FL=1